MASLVGTLNRANNELLHSLANAWGIDASGSDNRLLIRTILTKMLDRWHLRCKLEELGKAERQILFHLADSFDHWLTLSEVETYARLEGYDASQCVENLARSGLILVDDWQEFQKSLSPLRRLTRYPQPERGEPALALPAELVPEIEAVNDAMDQGDYSHYPVLAFLDATKARELQSVALRWNIPRPHSLSKQNLIQRLMEAITEGPGTWTASQWYSPQTTKVLGRIREKGGKAAVADLKSEFEAEELRQTYMDLNSAMMLEETYIDGRRFLFIPRDILAAMADEKALERTTLAPVQPSGEIDDSHLLLVEDLNTLMNFIIGNSIELTTASSIPQRTLTKLLALLVGEKDANPQSPRFTFVLDCAHRLGLVRGTGEKIVPGDSIDQWVQLSIAEQVKRIINVWLGSPRFEVPPGLDYFSSRISWPNARTRILKHLTANCKVGEWYYVQSLAELIVSSDRELLGGQATLGEMRRIGFLNKNELDKAILTFVINVLAFPLHWIGLVSLARMSAESTGSLCLSLTAMGGWALDAPGGAPPPEPSDKPLIVQPNFEILSISASGQVLRQLSRFADLTRADKARIYTMTKTSTLRGIDDGLTADGIIDFLNSYVQKDIPQNVAYSISDWARQFAPLSFSTATLVEVETEHVLTELMASTKFSSFFARRLSPKAAVLNPGADLRKLSNELRKRGYSPHVIVEQVTRK